MSNSENWYDLSEKDIQQLESIDEQLFRKIFSAPRSTPKELLYLESGSIPIKFILKSRRLNFLWYMLNEKDDSMLKQFLRAQCENPVKGDWVTTVLDDLQELDIKQNFDEISEIPKVTFKNIVNSKVKQKALNFLRNEQQTHSKSKNLHYSDLKLQDYLMSGLSIKEKSFIFLARSRMLNVKCNFKVGRTDLICSKCGLEDEEQEHLLSCTALKENSLVSSDYVPKYSDIFSNDSKKLEMIGKILMTKFKLLKNDNPLCTDGKSGAATVQCDIDIDVIKPVDKD